MTTYHPNDLRDLATRLRADVEDSDYDSDKAIGVAVADVFDAAASEDLRDFGDARSILAAVDRVAAEVDNALSDTAPERTP